MLEILAPRVIARGAGNYRNAGLDEKIFSKSRKLIEKALEGGTRLTRTEMYDVLEKAKISIAEQRGLHILGNLALEGLICLGPRIGKQPSFVLLDEWAPATKKLHRDEALAKLATIYFTSRGPATLQDFSWWSGLAVKEAATALELVKNKLVEEVIEKQTYWFSSSIKKIEFPAAQLLPAYDEYTVAYKDRSAVLNPAYAKKTGNGIFSPIIVIDGQIAGTWKRTLQKDSVTIEVTFLGKPKNLYKSMVEKAATRYGEFLSLPVKMS
jgi:hypothetical protein